MACAFLFSGCSFNSLSKALPETYQIEKIHTEYFTQELAYQKTQINPDNLLVFVDQTGADYQTSDLLRLFETTISNNKIYFKIPCPNKDTQTCGYDNPQEKAEAIMELIMAYSYPVSYQMYIVSLESLELKSFRIKNMLVLSDQSLSVDQWIEKQDNHKFPWQK